MVHGVTDADAKNAICNVGVEKKSFGPDQNTKISLCVSQCVKIAFLKLEPRS